MFLAECVLQFTKQYCFKKENMMGKGEGNGRIGSKVMEESDLGYLKPYGHPNTTGLQQEKGGRAHFFPGKE